MKFGIIMSAAVCLAGAALADEKRDWENREVDPTVDDHAQHVKAKKAERAQAKEEAQQKDELKAQAKQDAKPRNFEPKKEAKPDKKYWQGRNTDPDARRPDKRYYENRDINPAAPDNDGEARELLDAKRKQELGKREVIQPKPMRMEKKTENPVPAPAPAPVESEKRDDAVTGDNDPNDMRNESRVTPNPAGPASTSPVAPTPAPAPGSGAGNFDRPRTEQAPAARGDVTSKEPRYENPDDKRVGIAFIHGGGIGGFIDDRMTAATGAQGQWTSRVVFGTRRHLAGEAAYVGSAQKVSAAGVSPNSMLYGNGAEGAFRLNVLTGIWQPYVTAGLGFVHYNLNSSAVVSTSDVRSSANVLTLPVGVGIAWRVHGVVFDSKLSFHPATSGPFDGANMSTWDVQARAGFEI